MNDSRTPALEVALAYYEAWTRHDFEAAMAFVADDIVCDAPAGRIEGAEAFRGFMGPFAQILIEATLLGSFGDETTAMLMYDTQTRPVSSAPGAECHRVQDGRITHLTMIFDRTPFDLARRSAPTLS